MTTFVIRPVGALVLWNCLMNPISIRQIRAAVGGKALSVIADDAPMVTAVCTNSREMTAGSLFIAIRGEKFDGHKYVADAGREGAVAALVETAPTNPIPGMALILVANTRVAMGKLAAFCRQQIRAKVIAVAGSNGKTSTKRLIDAALRGKLRGSISPKSFNNDIGVPLTIFLADPNQDYLVLEIGTNHHGEIRVLTEMSKPDIAVITNCGADHLEFLGDVMGVRRENATIIAGLNPKGLLVVNGDDPELLAAVKDYPGQRITFGFKETNDLFATNIRCQEKGTRFSLNNSRREVFVPMLGKHSAANALAAIAVARKMGVPEDLAIASLAAARGPDMRLQWQSAGNIRLLNDAYNANPDSMRAAIETAAVMEHSSRRIAILGDMLELGTSSDRYHREIGQCVASARAFDLLICVGAQAALIAEAARAAGLPAENILQYRDALSASANVPMLLRDGDLVLLKASNGIHLEQIAEAIARRTAA
jgi:UDP-N-acetylmuramoyl-tripeptide--D-alanyl-D-alanine ligase